MIEWIYTIKNGPRTIITRNYSYAEQKSKQGYNVFCKRKTNIYRFNHL